MAKEMKVKITQEQGQVLLMTSGSLKLPERFEGEERSYSIPDRANANDEMLTLFRELKSRSPLCVTERRLCFGPRDNWAIGPKDDEATLTEPTKEVEIRLDDNARNGAYWCLLARLHPGNKEMGGASEQDEILWPLAKKLAMMKELKKDLRLEESKRRKIAFDDAEGKEESAKEEST